MSDVTFITKREIAPSVWEFSFRPDVPVQYTPGQYSRFTFPFHVDDPHAKQHRTFSFISHPSDDTLRVLIRFDAPVSAYKQHLLELQPSAAMHIDEPHGDAILPRLSSTPLVFIAQGIAIASYISMLQEVIAKQLPHPISLFWTKRPDDGGLDTLLPNATFASRSDIIYPDRLTPEPIITATTDDSLLYLSGGQQFVETLGESLEQAGTPRERIIYDYYEGYAQL